jgi:hypothetical protein
MFFFDEVDITKSMLVARFLLERLFNDLPVICYIAIENCHLRLMNADDVDS